LKKQRANTLQQRFGFADDDLKKSEHDGILLWLDDHAVEFVKAIIEWTDVWPARLVEQKVKGVTDVLKARAATLQETIARHDKFGRELLKDESERTRKEVALIDGYQGLGNPPSREVRMTKIWEAPVTQSGATTKYVIGFLDMVVLVENTELEVAGLYNDSSYVGFEEIRRPLPKWRVTWPDTPQRGLGFEAKVAIPSLGELIRQLRLYQQYCRYQLYVVSPDDRFAEQLLAQGFGFIKYPDGAIQKPAATRQ
jgi:hypothetical protein